MNWLDVLFSFSSIGIIIVLWLHWMIWGLMFLPPKIFKVHRLHMGGLGLALPGMVFIKEGQPISTLHHEQTHTLQMRRYSPTGVALYLGWHYGTGLAWQKVTGQKLNFWALWESNPLEIEANQRMYDHTTPLCIEPMAIVTFSVCTTLLIAGTFWMV